MFSRFRLRSKGKSKQVKRSGVSSYITRRSLPRPRFVLPTKLFRRRPKTVFSKSKRRLLTTPERRLYTVRRVAKNVTRTLLDQVAGDIYRVPAIELFKKTPAVSVCSRRGERREVLFAARVAGYRGRSPGRGGSYKRTPESTQVCRR